MFNKSSNFFLEGGDRSEIGVLRTLFAGGMAGVSAFLNISNNYVYIRVQQVKVIDFEENVIFTLSLRYYLLSLPLYLKILNWSIAIPQDVLKSRLQTAPEGQYSGIKVC